MGGTATLSDLLSAAAAAEPDRAAVEVDGVGRLTYGGWQRRSDALARGLQHHRIGPGERVALTFDAARWCEYAVAYLAVQRAAAVPVPLDPQVGGMQLERVLRDCEASAIVAPPGIGLPPAAVPVLRPADLEEEGSDPTRALPDRPPPLAEILYAARPLAVPVAIPRSHAALLSEPALLDESGGGRGTARSLVHALPVGSLAGQDVLRAALSPVRAGSLVLTAFDPDRFCALLSAAPGRGCVLHPAAAQALLDSGACAGHDLSRVARVVLTSGRVSAALLRDLADVFVGGALLLVDVLGHGPRGPGRTGQAAGARTAFLHDRSRPAAFGRPQEGTVVWVADERGQRAGPDEVGHVWMRRGGEAVDTGDLGSVDDDGLLHPSGARPGKPGEPVSAAAPADGAADQAEPPVAFSQEGMLWHEHFAPGCQNLPGLARRYRGPLDVDALARALDEIVRRHEALRTTFALRDRRLVQTVRAHRRLPLPVRDLAHLPADERDATVERLVADAGQRPFDLVSDAVFEPSLLRLADDDHVLVLRTHHSVFDDWSVGVFRRELSALYTAFSNGDASPLPELPLQFPDFARQQRRRLAGRTGTREMGFWRRELADAPLTTQLPVDDPDQPEGSPQHASEPVSLTLPPALHEGLGALARSQRATVFMTMLAAYGALVHRYTGQDDLLLATVVANRNRTELEGLIGCFTKKVPLRLRLGGDPPFTEALARTRAALMGALTHQDLPFEGIVQDVLGPPASAHGLVPQVVLMFQGETPRRELHLPGVETAGFETSTTARRAHFMAGDEEGGANPSPGEPWGAGLYLGTFVIVSVAESPDGLSCIARGAFHGPAVRELLDSFAVLLAGVAADPARPLSGLPLLEDGAKAGMRARGRGASDPPPDGTLHDAFAAQVRRTPHPVAVQTSADTLTFAELDTRSTRLAHRLGALGVAAGDTVGIASDLCADLVVAALGVWKAGAAWLALDPDDDEDRLTRIVGEAASTVVIGGDPHGVLARSAQVVAVGADGTDVLPDEASPADPPAGFPARSPTDPAVVFFGCGSSAVDRGVVLDHRGVLNLLTGLRRDVHPPAHSDQRPPGRRVFLCPHPTADGFLRQLVAVLDGHTLCVPDRSPATDPAGAVALVRSARVDVLDCTPADLGLLLEAGLQEALLGRGEDAVEPAVVVGTRRAVGPQLWRTVRGLAGVRAAVVYGPPECAFAATVRTATGASARPAVGRPLAGVGTAVLSEHGEPVPHRAVGELHLGGLSLARGSVGSSAMRGEERRGAPDEALPERDFATGHRARCLPDGTLELLGRVDDDADLRGFTVDPLRVSAALADCPGIRHVDVTLHRDERGEPKLVAHVSPDGPAPTLDQLRLHLWARLPGYAWPSAIVVTGPAPAPVPARPGQPAPHEPVLRALWAEVLGTDQVAGSHNYWQRFSFLEVLARAREAGLSVTGDRVTRNRTVATLAADLAAGGWPPGDRPATGPGANQ